MGADVNGAGYIVLTYKFQKVDRRWTALCDELGTAAFGRSLPEAEKRLDEAVELHLDTLEEVGELRRFFKENHIKFYTSKPHEDISISLPLKPEIFVHPHIRRVSALSAA
jgi:predicted RNase H-like HicB family nuclease